MIIKKENNKYKINILGLKISINSKKNYLKNADCYNFNGNNNQLLIEDDGKLIEETKKIQGLDIYINGDNNKIIISKKTLNSFSHSSIVLNSNNSIIEIKESVFLQHLHITSDCGNNQKVYWGKYSTCHGVNVFLNEENSSLIVGEDCMFSLGINIWATDGHAIIDKKTSKIINHLKTETKIGDHVWVGAHTTILKNANIKNNSVIGASSLVASNFEVPNVIIAGNPAKIIKKDIDWDRENAYSLEKRRQKVN